MRHAFLLTPIAFLLAPAAIRAQSRQDPVTSQDIQRLKRQLAQELRSSVELLFDVHGEEGGLNDRLSFWRYGARLNLLRGQPGSSVYATLSRTRYSSGEDVLQTWGTRAAGGFRKRLSERSDAQVEAGFTHFGTGATTVDGLASYTTRLIEAARLTVSASRSNVEESFLSVAGVTPVVGPFAGELVGNVMENRVSLGGDYRLPQRFDVYAEVSLGTRAGHNVDSNSFKRASAGLGWSVIAREADSSPSLVRISFAVDYFGYADDRFGYGGASLVDENFQPIPLDLLGSDGISPDVAEGHSAIGGYFSPDRFLSLTARAEMRGRSGTTLDYRLNGFVGRQTYTGVDPRLAAGVSGYVVFNLSERVSVPLTALWEDYGPFRQHLLQARLLVRF